MTQRADTSDASHAMRLAVLGDIHLFRLRLPPWRMLNKRMLGQVNLWLDRRRRFDPTLLSPILDRVRSIRPGMLLLSGDVTTTSLPEEFDDVKAALATLGDLPVFGIPGNHDRYTFTSSRRRVFETKLPGLSPPAYPHLQDLAAPWKLLAIDAAMPRMLTARGRVGAVQLDEVRRLLEPLSQEQGVVVLCHYPTKLLPPGVYESWQHRLTDAAELLDVLRSCKARIIYVHGHLHLPWCLLPPHAAADGLDHVIDVNAGAPCMCGGDYPGGQGFWQIDLPADAAMPIHFTHHVPHRDAGGAFRWDARAVRTAD